MKHCSKCKLDVRTNSEVCPLCQNKLTGENEEAMYPTIPTIYKKFELFFKIFFMASIGLAVVCVATNLMFSPSNAWWPFAVFGIFCIWLSVFHIIKRRKNIPKTILTQAVISAVLCVIWDFWTGWHGWSIDFVLPIIFTVAMIGLFIVARCLKLKEQEYIMHFTTIVVFCIITVIFYALDITNIVIPSIICFSSGIITLAALIIFDGKSMKEELRKRFHL
ncbi:MAG: hypothetical protein IJP09_00910 [Clostridia bacterium]|nr:hypothetical protein [Clostridia bacterium]